MSESITQEQIYKFLQKEFPGQYPQLLSVPREISHPGDAPKQPRQNRRVSVSLNANEPISSLIEKLIEGHSSSGGYLSLDIHDADIICHRKVLKTRTRKYKTLYTYDDGHKEEFDVDDDAEEFDTSYEVPIEFGEVNSVDFNFMVENSSYRHEMEIYNREQKEWQQRINARRERHTLIQSLQKQNNEIIRQARSANLELWKQAGTFLAKKDSRTWLQIRADHLRSQLSEVECQLFNTCPPGCPIVEDKE